MTAQELKTKIRLRLQQQMAGDFSNGGLFGFSKAQLRDVLVFIESFHTDDKRGGTLKE